MPGPTYKAKSKGGPGQIYTAKNKVRAKAAAQSSGSIPASITSGGRSTGVGSVTNSRQGYTSEPKTRKAYQQAQSVHQRHMQRVRAADQRAREAERGSEERKKRREKTKRLVADPRTRKPVRPNKPQSAVDKLTRTAQKTAKAAVEKTAKKVKKIAKEGHFEQQKTDIKRAARQTMKAEKTSERRRQRWTTYRKRHPKAYEKETGRPADAKTGTKKRVVKSGPDVNARARESLPLGQREDPISARKKVKRAKREERAEVMADRTAWREKREKHRDKIEAAVERQNRTDRRDMRNTMMQGFKKEAKEEGRRVFGWERKDAERTAKAYVGRGAKRRKTQLRLVGAVTEEGKAFERMYNEALDNAPPEVREKLLNKQPKWQRKAVEQRGDLHGPIKSSAPGASFLTDKQINKVRREGVQEAQEEERNWDEKSFFEKAGQQVGEFIQGSPAMAKMAFEAVAEEGEYIGKQALAGGRKAVTGVQADIDPPDREMVKQMMKGLEEENPLYGFGAALLSGGSIDDAAKEYWRRGQDSPLDVIADATIIGSVVGRGAVAGGQLLRYGTTLPRTARAPFQLGKPGSWTPKSQYETVKWRRGYKKKLAEEKLAEKAGAKEGKKKFREAQRDAPEELARANREYSDAKREADAARERGDADAVEHHERRAAVAQEHGEAVKSLVRGPGEGRYAYFKRMRTEQGKAKAQGAFIGRARLRAEKEAAFRAQAPPSVEALTRQLEEAQNAIARERELIDEFGGGPDDARRAVEYERAAAAVQKARNELAEKQKLLDAQQQWKSMQVQLDLKLQSKQPREVRDAVGEAREDEMLIQQIERLEEQHGRELLAGPLIDGDVIALHGRVADAVEARNKLPKGRAQYIRQAQAGRDVLNLDKQIEQRLDEIELDLEAVHQRRIEFENKAAEWEPHHPMEMDERALDEVEMSEWYAQIEDDFYELIEERDRLMEARPSEQELERWGEKVEEAEVALRAGAKDPKAKAVARHERKKRKTPEAKKKWRGERKKRNRGPRAGMDKSLVERLEWYRGDINNLSGLELDARYSANWNAAGPGTYLSTRRDTALGYAGRPRANRDAPKHMNWRESQIGSAESVRVRLPEGARIIDAELRLNQYPELMGLMREQLDKMKARGEPMEFDPRIINPKASAERVPYKLNPNGTVWDEWRKFLVMVTEEGFFTKKLSAVLEANASWGQFADYVQFMRKVRQAGFEGLTHTGGRGPGMGLLHRVVVLFDPQDAFRIGKKTETSHLRARGGTRRLDETILAEDAARKAAFARLEAGEKRADEVEALLGSADTKRDPLHYEDPYEVGFYQSYSRALPTRLAQKGREHLDALRGRDPFTLTGKRAAKKSRRMAEHQFRALGAAGRSGTAQLLNALVRAEGRLGRFKGPKDRARWEAALTLRYTDGVRFGNELADLEDVAAAWRFNKGNPKSLELIEWLKADLKANGDAAVIRQVNDAVDAAVEFSRRTGSDLMDMDHHSASANAFRIGVQGALYRGQVQFLRKGEVAFYDADFNPLGVRSKSSAQPEGWVRMVEGESRNGDFYIVRPEGFGTYFKAADSPKGGYIDPLAAERAGGRSKFLGLGQEQSGHLSSADQFFDSDLSMSHVFASLESRNRFASWQRMIEQLHRISPSGGPQRPEVWLEELGKYTDAGEDWVALATESRRMDEIDLDEELIVTDLDLPQGRLGETDIRYARPDEDAILVPKLLAKSLERQFSTPRGVSGYGQWLNRIFVGAVLPFSVVWHVGNQIDLMTRVAVAGGNPYADAALARQLYKNMRDGQGEDAAARIYMNQAAHFGSQAKVSSGLKLRYVTEQSKYNGIRTLGDAATRFRHETKTGRAAIGGPAAVKEAAFDAASAFEQPWLHAAQGRSARLLAREIGIDISDHVALAERLTKELVDNPSLADEFARKTVEIIGDYSFSPLARTVLAPIDPFFRWAYEANKFVFYHFPAKHPVKFALFALASQMSYETAQDLGLEGYLEGTGILGIPLGGTGYLQGAIPVGDGFYRPTSPFTSWGEAARLLESPWEYTAGRIFPYTQGIGAAAAGYDPTRKWGDLGVKALGKWIPALPFLPDTGIDYHASNPDAGGSNFVQRGDEMLSAGIRSFIPGANQLYSLGRGGGLPEGDIFDMASKKGTEVPWYENQALNAFGMVRDPAQIPEDVVKATAKATAHKPEPEVNFVLYDKDGKPYEVTGRRGETETRYLSGEQARRRSGKGGRKADAYLGPIREAYLVNLRNAYRGKNKSLPVGVVQAGTKLGVSRREMGRVINAAERAHKEKRKLSLPSGVPAEYREAIAKWGPKLDDVASQYGMDGITLMAKTFQGESGWDSTQVSIADAAGAAQVIPSTRDSIMAQGGPDPWSGNPMDEAEAMYMHMSGKFGFNPGLEGYNPNGGEAYVNYILDQDVGSVDIVPIRKIGTRGANAHKFVQKLFGAKVKGDKEPGHTVGGDHDPSIRPAQAYAQDIGSAGANPAENEPPYSQETVDVVVKNLRKRGADISKDFKLGDDWEGSVDGYRVQFLTAPHGTGPHIHLGARVSGDVTPYESSGGVEVTTDGFAGGNATTEAHGAALIHEFRDADVPISVAMERMMDRIYTRRVERDLWLERQDLSYAYLRGEIDTEEYTRRLLGLESEAVRAVREDMPDEQ